MIHNSQDYMQALDGNIDIEKQDQNESWISLKSLKQVINISQDKDNERYQSMRQSIKDQNEQKSTFISQETVSNSFDTLLQQRQNQFKRSRKVAESQQSVSYPSNYVEAFREEQQLNIQKRDNILNHFRKQSAIIGQHQTIQDEQSYSNPLSIIEYKEYQEEDSYQDKENQGIILNTSSDRFNNSNCIVILDQPILNQEKQKMQLNLKLVDKEYEKFQEQVDKIKKQINPQSSRVNKPQSLCQASAVALIDFKQPKTTAEKMRKSMGKLDHSFSKVQEFININAQEEVNKENMIPPLQGKNKFKKQSKNKKLSMISNTLLQQTQDLDENISKTLEPEDLSQSQIKIDEVVKQNQLQRREIQKLQRQIDTIQKQNEQETVQLKKLCQEESTQRVKDIEEENLIIIEGLKSEYEDRLRETKQSLLQQELKFQEERENLVMHYERKLEKKRNKMKLLKDDQQREKDQRDQIIRMLKEEADLKLEEVQSSQYNSRQLPNKKSIIDFGYNSMNQDSLQKDNMFRVEVLNNENNQCLSVDDFNTFKKRILQQHFNSNNNISILQTITNQNNISQDESAMNFSFSDVKNSIDKSALFERNMMILHTDYPQEYEMLERASQEDVDDDDEEQFNSKQLNTNQDYEGSENAPDDSAYISDEDNMQEKIVNESSIIDENEERQDFYTANQMYYQNDDNLMMTGRSESMVDDLEEDDDSENSLSKCKAINSSYINLKRNNLLINYTISK